MHKQFMQKALEQARLGRGICAPNPSVGAVVVRNDEIIGFAYHQGVGTAHAEQHALQQIPQGLSSTTLYVTLEPCNHWGKTPPCVSAILDYGVSTVVYGFSDPNPLVAENDTPRILRQHGIDVIHYPLPEIDAFYRSYQYWTQFKKPWLTAKIAQTLDGKIAGEGGFRVQLSNEKCTQFTHTQRSFTDIILTSAKTIENDSPLLNVRMGDMTKSKPVAILDRTVALPADASIFKTASHCYVFHGEGTYIEKPIANCSYFAVRELDGLLDLHAVVDYLGKLGFHDVWVEAGGHLFSSLHEQALIQTTYLYIVPTILGEKALNAYQGTNFFNHSHTISWLPQADNMIACVEWSGE